MVKKNYCKICALDELERSFLEKMIINSGHWRNPVKPLAATQIAYVMFLIFNIKLDRHTIYKHKKKCMGNPKVNVPIHWSPKLKEHVDADGVIVPREVYRDRH